MDKLRVLGLSSSFLVLVILIVTNGGVLIQNAFGSIEDFVDEIVESAEYRDDQAREEAENIAEEAREYADDQARDNEEDEEELDKEELDRDNTDNDNDRGNDVSSFDVPPGTDVGVIGDPGSMDPDSIFDIDDKLDELGSLDRISEHVKDRFRDIDWGDIPDPTKRHLDQIRTFDS